MAAIKISCPRKAFVAAAPATQSRKSVITAATHKITFVNNANGKEKIIECPDDEYVLDAAEMNGISFPSSCRGGVCGSCVSKLHSGQVDQSWLCELDDGNVLNSEQMAAGFILPCSAKPLSDLRIEYNLEWGVAILEQDKWKQLANSHA